MTKPADNPISPDRLRDFAKNDIGGAGSQAFLEACAFQWQALIDHGAEEWGAKFEAAALRSARSPAPAQQTEGCEHEWEAACKCCAARGTLAWSGQLSVVNVREPAPPAEDGLEAEAKGCPFCGSEPVVAQADNAPAWWIVECRSAKCDITPSYQSIGRGDVVAAWNTRAANLDTRLAASAIAKLTDARAKLSAAERERDEARAALPKVSVPGTYPTTGQGPNAQVLVPCAEWEALNRDLGLARLRAAPAAGVWVTDIEKAAAEIARETCWPLAPVLAILRDCSRTADADELAKALQDATSLRARTKPEARVLTVWSQIANDALSHLGLRLAAPRDESPTRLDLPMPFVGETAKAYEARVYSRLRLAGHTFVCSEEYANDVLVAQPRAPFVADGEKIARALLGSGPIGIQDWNDASESVRRNAIEYAGVAIAEYEKQRAEYDRAGDQAR